MDSLIAILILRALALEAQGERDRAVDVLEQALIPAAGEGYVRVFVDEGAPMAVLLAGALEAVGCSHGSQTRARDVRAYAGQLLAVLRAEGIEPLGIAQPPILHRPIMPPSGEALTEREMEVLRHLAAGRSNQAIARELVVAVSTVKKHVNNIFGKLAVESRTQALVRAQELRLL